jgi:acetolactate synthase-1/2/3 large subunit
MLSQAWEEVRKFAELIGAPVVTTLTAKGIIPENHPLSLGCGGRQGYRPTANEAVEDADLVIALGTKFAQVATNNWTLIDEDRTKIIHIDIDPSELRKKYGEEVAIVADVKSALLDLIEALSVRLSKGGLDRSRWVGKVANLKKEWVMLYERLSTETSEPLKAAVVFREIQKFMPAKGVLVSSGSFSGAFAGCYYNVNQSDGRRFIQARGMAGTEAALPLAIGVSLGVQDGSKVLAVTGDGGFGYHIAELETARRTHLSLPIVVLNNNSLAWMKLLQRDRFGSNYISSQYSVDLNYAKISEAFGCEATRVEKMSELSSEIGRAMKTDNVFVLEVMTDPSDCSSTHMVGDPLAKREAVY